MKLEEFKKQAKDIEKCSLDELKNEVINNYEQMFEVDKSIEHIRNGKNKKVKDELLNEIWYLFSDNELKKSKTKDSVTISFKDSSINVEVNETNDGFLQCSVYIKPSGIENIMDIEPNSYNKALFLWNGIPLNGEWLREENYNYQINKCKDEDKLNEINQNIIKDISEHQYLKSQIDDMRYLYKEHKGTRIFENFRDFFENYVGKE